MSNGYSPQVPSPIASMGEPSEKQKALLPLMNKMRQDMMAAGINPDDQMMPPNLTGAMPPGGGPPPPTMAPHLYPLVSPLALQLPLSGRLILCLL